jgi:DNA invertase Pin-like site-specific DNA recombinase
MAILGYARVSTNGQDLAGQVAALQARCVRIYREKASGAKTDRPELAKLLRALGPGDVPIVTRLDRLPLKLCCCSRRIAVASRAAFTSRPVAI